MYLGRKQIGDKFMIPVQTVNASGVPTRSTVAPYVYTYAAASTTPIESLRAPIIDKSDTTGMFACPVFLGGLYSTGHHHVTAKWAISGQDFQETYDFDVVPGGSPLGPIIAMHPFRRPENLLLPAATASGNIVKNRAPRYV